MIVRYDPRDLSRIYLLAPDGHYYDLNYRDLRRPPITLWEHRLALKRLREEGRANIDESAIFRAIETCARSPTRRSSPARQPGGSASAACAHSGRSNRSYASGSGARRS